MAMLMMPIRADGIGTPRMRSENVVFRLLMILDRFPKGGAYGILERSSAITAMSAASMPVSVPAAPIATPIV
jgi:hypothetical protein